MTTGHRLTVELRRQLRFDARQKVRIIGEKASLEWWDEQPNQLRYEIQGEPVRILERGMDYLDPLARQDDRIGGGHPEGLFEAWSNLYRRFAIAMDAADRRDEALLADFWYRTPAPGRSASLGGKLRTFCRQRRLLGRLPLTRRLRAFVLSLYSYFFCPRQLGFIRLMGAVRQPLERSGAIVLRGNRQRLHIVPWIDLQFAKVA
jgi:hypothetical protein